MPLLRGGAVIVLGHPSGFESDNIARHALAPERERLIHHVEGINVLVADVGKRISPDRQQRRAPAERRVGVEQAPVIRPAEQIVVEIAPRRGADDPVRIALADVHRVPPGGVHQQAPAPVAQHHRNRDIRLHVAHPKFIDAGAAHDVLAADIAQPIDALVLGQRETDIIAAAGFKDGRGLLRQRVSVGSRQSDGAVLAVDREPGPFRGDRVNTTVLRPFKRHLGKDRAENAVAVQTRFRPLRALAVADAEQPFAQNIHAHESAPIQIQDHIACGTRRRSGIHHHAGRLVIGRRACAHARGNIRRAAARCRQHEGDDRGQDHSMMIHTNSFHKLVG